MPSSPNAFRLFGFPVRVGAGFWMFLVLIAVLNSSEEPNGLGVSGAITFAVLIAVLTLIHELGHALAARATGAKAEITLAFMAGYASFVPTRQLSRAERIGISFAGPAIQIAVGSLVYFVVGGPFEWPIRHLTPVQFGALWSGPIMGAFNLIPILPFDGGSIMEQVIGTVVPRHARRVMTWFTLLVSGAGLVYIALHPHLRWLIIFALIPLVSALQIMTAGRSQQTKAQGQEAMARAEALAWGAGDLSRFGRDLVPSPWFRAAQQLDQGHPEIARQVLLDDFADATGTTWWPPDAAPARTLEALVALLPDPLPHGRPFSDFVLSGVLLRLGDYERAAHYASAAYSNGRPAMLAVHVARAAEALGDRATALAWLRTAARTAPPEALRTAVQTAPEFDLLRADPDLDAAFSG